MHLSGMSIRSEQNKFAIQAPTVKPAAEHNQDHVPGLSTISCFPAIGPTPADLAIVVKFCSTYLDCLQSPAFP
eukprot:c4957_g1_i1 orf=1-216(-)